MKYEIWCNGILIAKFEHKSDRDFCLDAFEEYHSDCEFSSKDNE